MKHFALASILLLSLAACQSAGPTRDIARSRGGCTPGEPGCGGGFGGGDHDGGGRDRGDRGGRGERGGDNDGGSRWGGGDDNDHGRRGRGDNGDNNDQPRWGGGNGRSDNNDNDGSRGSGGDRGDRGGDQNPPGFPFPGPGNNGDHDGSPWNRGGRGDRDRQDNDGDRDDHNPPVVPPPAPPRGNDNDGQDRGNRGNRGNRDDRGDRGGRSDTKPDTKPDGRPDWNPDRDHDGNRGDGRPGRWDGRDGRGGRWRDNRRNVEDSRRQKREECTRHRDDNRDRRHQWRNKHDWRHDRDPRTRQWNYWGFQFNLWYGKTLRPKYYSIPGFYWVRPMPNYGLWNYYQVEIAAQNLENLSERIYDIMTDPGIRYVNPSYRVKLVKALSSLVGAAQDYTDSVSDSYDWYESMGDLFYLNQELNRTETVLRGFSQARRVEREMRYMRYYVNELLWQYRQNY